MKNPLDEKVLNHLLGRIGATAWIISLAVKRSREDVSKACQRLKRKGLVSADGTYWQAVKS